MSDPARWFIGAATTTWLPESGLEDRPELADEVRRMTKLFSGLGYKKVPGFGLNLSATEFLGSLRRFLKSHERRDDDIVAVYYTGHGLCEGDELLLPMADATADLSFSGMSAADLTGRLLRGSSTAQRLLFILDTCHAGAAGHAMTGGAIDFINCLRGPAVSPSVAIVVAARLTESAGPGEFSRAFADAVMDSVSGSDEPEFLDLDDLVNAVNETTPAWQHARTFVTSDGFGQYFPNPHYDRLLRDQDLRAEKRNETLNARRDEVANHVLPRARGLVSNVGYGEDLWLFTGRYQALRAVCDWLRSPGGPATMVITGDPGSGKSALLARLYVLAGELSSRVRRRSELPLPTVPPADSITRFINARGLTADQVMAGLCEACNVDDTNSPGKLLASVASRGEPVVVIVDAIDEATASGAAHTPGDFPVIDQVLSPLVSGAGRTQLRLLLGTRRNVLPVASQLPAPGQLPARTGLIQVIDLDRSEYADRPGHGCLRSILPDSLVP